MALHYDAAERALLEGQISSLVVTLYDNEKPLSGLAGILDWQFNGALSSFLKEEVVTGKPGECVYLPVTRNQSIYHLILIGAGKNNSPGQRHHLPTSTLHILQKNLISLRFSKVGISKSDFGSDPSDYLSKHLKGVPLWIAP